jgi:hypothetical protein
VVALHKAAYIHLISRRSPAATWSIAMTESSSEAIFSVESSAAAHTHKLTASPRWALAHHPCRTYIMVPPPPRVREGKGGDRL